MALVLADRVKETTTTTGTGTVTLAGAATGYQSFSAVGNGNTTYYTIADQTGANWEVGVGTYTASGTTLSRDTVLASSNAGALVNFGAGTKDVFVTYPSGYANTAQVGDVVLATTAPNGPGTWLETGKYYSKATYPKLATAVGDVPDIGSMTQIPQAQLPVAFSANASGFPYITATDGTTTVVVGTVGAIRKTTDGTTWVPVPSGAANQLNSVAYLNSNFVAVGVGGNIVTSSDGINWVARTPQTTVNLNSVAFGNTRYVAVGASGNIVYSTDLVTWLLATGTGTAAFNKVVYANSIFVAVGASGAVYTSSDGITWTSRSAGAAQFNDVIYANSLFVAVGASGSCYTSPDGVTWTSRSAGANQFNQIIYANSLFIVVGNTNTIYTSTDGVTWTARTSGFGSTSININAVCWNGTNFVVTGFYGRWASSSDGITWSANVDISLAFFYSLAVINGKTINFGSTSSVILAGASRTEVFFNGGWAYTVVAQSATNPRTIAYNGSNQYVAAGSTGFMLASSDGQTWTASNTGVATNFDKVFSVNSNYIALGAASGGFLTSTDGTTWTSRTTPTATDIGNAAAFGSSTYVIVSATSTTNGYIYSSTDLITWTTRVTETIPFYDCIFANSLFVAVGGTGNGSSGSGVCYTSSNGTSWTQRSTSSLVGWNRVIYANGLYVVVGQAGRINTSPDGITWTNRTSGVTAILNDVVWNGSIFCAVGASGVITTSPDGITWTARTPGDTTVTLLSVSWNGTRFVVTNSTNGVAWVSTDGITWTRASTAYRGTTLYSAYLGGKFLAIGTSFIQTSTDGLNWRNCDHVQYVPNAAARLYKLGSYYYAATAQGLFQSSDGITFTIAGKTIPPASVVSLAYSGSAWLAVMAAAVGQPQSYYKSTDGLTWSKSADLGTLTTTSTVAGAVSDLVYANGNFISGQAITAAQNISGGAYTSPDGVTWTPRVLPFGAQAQTSGVISSIASDGSTVLLPLIFSNSVLAKSTDGGITWTYVAALGGGAIYSSGFWWVGSYVSTDATNFQSITGVTTFQNGIYVYNNKYAIGITNASSKIIYAANGGSSILYSTQPNYLFNSTGASGKEFPLRGTTLLNPNNQVSNSISPNLIGEFPLYSYNTTTTFWVPPQAAGGGQVAYIYAGA